MDLAYKLHWKDQKAGRQFDCLCGCGFKVARDGTYRRRHAPAIRTVPCACGCSGLTKNGQYLSGHRPTAGEVMCSRCRVYKPDSEFYRNKSGARAGTIAHYCKPCQLEFQQRRYDARRKPIVPRGWQDKSGYRHRSVRGRHILEHRLVMERFLGRPLLSHENVHHINGDRSDNRLENLELWSSSQPNGQRVKDKVAWARDIIALYGDLWDQPLLRVAA